MRTMKTCRFVVCAVLASVALAYGGGEGDASLERVKANFVHVLRDTNALVYSEIAKMGGEPPVADSNIRAVAESGGVSEKHVERLIREQRADGSWPSVDYTTALRSQWPANEHLKNLRTLAGARRTPETEQAFHKALGFWLNGRFRNPNWWWNQIGVPLSVGASALLMDDVRKEQEVDQVLVCGGVASSRYLRRYCEGRGFMFGRPELCSDNAVGAALIGGKAPWH